MNCPNFMTFFMDGPFVTRDLWGRRLNAGGVWIRDLKLWRFVSYFNHLRRVTRIFIFPSNLFSLCTDFNLNLALVIHDIDVYVVLFLSMYAQCKSA